MDFDLAQVRGLSGAEARQRLLVDGYNELPAAKSRSGLAIVLEVIQEPMFLLLIACGSLYLLLGDIQEALMLLGFVFLVIGITVFQEQKTERALEALRDLSSPRALVLRDGSQIRIPGREVVKGDIILLAEGDRVPADAVLLWALNLKVDESLLTGESLPVGKVASSGGEVPLVRPGGEDLPFVYSGTLVVQGQGVARVLATGAATELGKIGKALQTVEDEETGLHRETRRLVKVLAISGLALCVGAVIIYGLTRGDWLAGLLAGITLAMAMVPEEFPVVLTVFLALGAWRISKQNALTRRMPAIETLGSATVLCVDKTGTLTQNKMVVSQFYANGQWLTWRAPGQEFGEAFHEIIEYSMLASKKDPFDPMERALNEFGELNLKGSEHLHPDWTLVKEYPLSREFLAVTQVWQPREREGLVAALKGAPETVIDLCHLSEPERQTISAATAEMAARGLRVLGVAKAELANGQGLTDNRHDLEFEFVGLVGLADPIRPSVPAAIEECRTAGIRVVMITGDYPGTALSIAEQIGLESPRVITGPELDALSDEALAELIGETNIFARVVPEQKLRIVNALKQAGEVVAMTGDGVNDAPALKAAHIGVAMGGRGTDVAREASDIVLLDDDFSTIVSTVRQGRRIYDNLKKTISYIFAIHVPIAGLSLIPILLKWPLALFPVHIVFLELIIDPACSIVFEAEPEESNLMARPPRDPRTRLLDWRTVGLSLLQGLGVLLIVTGVYRYMLVQRGLSAAEARSAAFAALIAANLALILTNRSWHQTIIRRLRQPNRALWWVVGGAAFLLFLVLWVPALQTLFHLAPLNLADQLICVALGLASILWFEGQKIWLARRNGKGEVAGC